jgi:hypothetical protein
MKSMSNREYGNELDWLAFCYAAGEMTPAEADVFEQRLADDQAAREALARAVELTEVVATAETLEPVLAAVLQHSSWTRRLSWMALGAAASLLVALLWSGAGWWPAGAQSPSRDQTELAWIWTQMGQELAASESDLWYPKHLAASDTAELAESGSDDAQQIGAPDWLTAAVESYATDPADPDKTPFDGERREN